MKTKKPTSHGFTIVELIIVIVVIGILAATVIVAYNGIQQQAKGAAVLADLDNAVSSLEYDLRSTGSYPATVLAANNGNGLPTKSGTVYQYIVDTSTTSPKFCLTGTNGSTSYSVSQDGPPQSGRCNLLSNSAVEKIGGSEFLQYADLAPIFDTYGMVKYTVSFDIKSANTSSQNTMVVYMQNGSSSKYNFVYKSVPVTTSYTRQSATGTVSLSNAADTKATLAFYGTYGSGNIPSVKNVKIEFGDTASAWSPGL